MSNLSSVQNVQYHAVPLSSEERGHSPAPYSADSGEVRASTYHTPTLGPVELHPDDVSYSLTPDIPPETPQPRFFGAAMYTEQGGFRDSYASATPSQHSFARSDYNSLYALDPAGGYQDDPHTSYQHGQYPMTPMSPLERNRFLEEKHAAYAAPREKSKRRFVVLAVIVGLLLLVIAVGVPVYLFVIKPKSVAAAATTSGPGTTATPTATPTSTKSGTLAVTGGDGSTVTMEDGTTFIYHNKFGGYWYYDEEDPFNNGARAQSWSPALNETFNYGVDQIRGVNIGGWLVTEPFIAPALYQKYSSSPTPPVDEWTLCQAMRADSAGGGIDQLETHYKTFITEKDFAEIAAAGLNYIRVPIGYWAIEIRDNEPFLSKVSWTYFLKAIKWARKYGLRINLDLHALPGSQNGWNHSGRLGTIGFLNGPMGYANAQRSLDYIRIFAQFISQPQYKDVVTMFGIINEPSGTTGKENLSRFYLRAYDIIRTAGGTGTGNGPFISIHDGFSARSAWVDTFPNADRLALDTHPYLAFGAQTAGAMSSFVNTPCTSWGSEVNSSMSAFGLTTAGEWSNAVNDCGLFLNNVGGGSRYEGTFTGTTTRVGSCSTWLDWPSYDDAMKTSIRQFALSTMDALQHYFFWTWKIGNSTTSGRVESPAWSYQLGLQQGWMPTDPRDAVGACGNTSPWTPPLRPWQTGGAGAGIPASVSSSYSWPPTAISQAGSVSSLPFYTPTGPIPTLPVPTFTAKKSINAGNGWANPSDTESMHVPIPTCTYLDPWVDPGTAPPPTCGSPSAARRAVEPLITPPPS